LVVLAASSCQLLSFLAVAARARIDVVDYQDDAEGEMPEAVTPMRITRIVLHLVGRVDALGDVRRLLADRDRDAARLAVEALGRRVVADPQDRVSHDPRDIHVTGRRHLTGDMDQTGRDHGLHGHAAGPVLGEHRIKDRVADLVADLVGVTLGD